MVCFADCTERCTGNHTEDGSEDCIENGSEYCTEDYVEECIGYCTENDHESCTEDREGIVYDAFSRRNN